jgi:hypothetical protein
LPKQLQRIHNYWHLDDASRHCEALCRFNITQPTGYKTLWAPVSIAGFSGLTAICERSHNRGSESFWALLMAARPAMAALYGAQVGHQSRPRSTRIPPQSSVAICWSNCWHLLFQFRAVQPEGGCVSFDGESRFPRCFQYQHDGLTRAIKVPVGSHAKVGTLLRTIFVLAPRRLQAGYGYSRSICHVVRLESLLLAFALLLSTNEHEIDANMRLWWLLLMLGVANAQFEFLADLPQCAVSQSRTGTRRREVVLMGESSLAYLKQSHHRDVRRPMSNACVRTMHCGIRHIVA